MVFEYRKQQSNILIFEYSVAALNVSGCNGTWNGGRAATSAHLRHACHEEFTCHSSQFPGPPAPVLQFCGAVDQLGAEESR